MRTQTLPYSRQSINIRDQRAVVRALRSRLITQGPEVERFENKFAKIVDAKHAIAFSSGTAALHAAMYCADISPGDEVITTPLTFAATANSALYCGGKPIFADVGLDGNVDPSRIERLINDRTRALLPVHYSGRPCDMGAIHSIAKRHRLMVVEDACHALGASCKGRLVGSLPGTVMTVFSMHPVKHITTAEGGMVTTDSSKLAQRLASFRSHGVVRDRYCQRRGAWYYEVRLMGFNYRLSDLHAALGVSQLDRLGEFLSRRRELARRYEDLLADEPRVRFLPDQPDRPGSYHLFPILLNTPALVKKRRLVFDALLAEGIGAQVHYIPLSMQPHFQKEAGADPDEVPNAIDFYRREISIPLFPDMTRRDQDDVMRALRKVLDHFDPRPIQ